MYLKPFWNENSKKALLFYGIKVSKTPSGTNHHQYMLYVYASEFAIEYVGGGWCYALF